ncbi:isoprenylcysteine carboxylmethyltransferase family protein [Oleiagrimonas sp.]|jgi:protein-S-isoprenylcysteine O-methyltransferase Ste14|uniref:methyltransferase family protein n=1 Tax=Oleiagrimonas sp. TaxID=2010330 RepID=UPI002634983A|nr:isoprenylcysteine carboxylmethyltransferase family protein [Oleiagrimonas sp.]MDA3913875.1 isoprenylcysteine carboxylmethyltransferase family protein [Oleiagrimonas sp.]
MNQTEQGMTHEIEEQGQWLFHRRSYFGLVILPALALAILYPGPPSGPEVQHHPDMLGVIGLLISVLGLLVRWITAGTVPADTSRRSTRELRADTLNSVGMYSVVRHPLYLANTLIVTGFVVAVGSIWFFVMFQLAHALYIERVMAAEERFLKQMHGDAWKDWAARTPALIPRLRLWQSNPMLYSVRTVLRREYNGVFMLALAFFVLQAARAMTTGHMGLRQWIGQDHLWLGLLVAAGVLFLLLRTLKRHTRLLHVSGR